MLLRGWKPHNEYEMCWDWFSWNIDEADMVIPGFSGLIFLNWKKFNKYIDY